jgi:hypothetical protein
MLRIICRKILPSGRSFILLCRGIRYSHSEIQAQRTGGEFGGIQLDGSCSCGVDIIELTREDHYQAVAGF